MLGKWGNELTRACRAGLWRSFSLNQCGFMESWFEGWKYGTEINSTNHPPISVLKMFEKENYTNDLR